MGASVFPKEILRASKRWASGSTPTSDTGESLRPVATAAFEQPSLFVDEVRAFFRTVR